ncbi:Bbp19 family protein [Enterobacter chengduensis]|uniref:Bbp19 family protein n=1 Tax=Enterobacter cloacae complex TaxID=354276 RepID=UPI002FFA8CB8
MTDFDEEELRIQNERKKHDLEQREKDDIKFVMDSEQGRRVVWGLLEKGQVFGTCFNVDPNITAFNEGQRNLALVLFQRVMTHCPDQYLKMAEEASEQE